MRFPLWLKLSFVLSLIFIAALWAVLKNTNKVFYQDKHDFLIEMSSKINSSNAKLLQERVQNLQRKLAIFTSNYQSLSPQQKNHPDLDKVIFNQYPEFLAIGLVAETASPIQWLRKQPNTVPSSWPDSEWASIMSGYATKKLEAGSVQFENFQNAQNQHYLVIVLPVEMPETKITNAKIVGFLDTQIFSDFLSEYKTSLNSVFVTDRQGFLFAHPFPAEVGKNISEHGVVKDLVQNQKTQGAGDSYVDLNGAEVVASYQSINGTNLSIFTSTPKAEAFQAANELWRTLVLIALGVILIGIVVSFLFAKIITNPLNRLRATAAEIGKGDFKVKVDVSSKDEVGDLAKSIRQMTKDLIERDEALEHSKNALIQSEKMSAFGQLSAGIAHEVKNPLAGILGHAQLAKSKTQDDEILKHVGFIEKETRRTKEIIENLMKFARAEKLELVPTNLYDTVSGAADLVDHQLSLQGVKIHRHIKPVSAVAGNSNQIQQVLLNLMMNAGHAMEDAEKKELHVYLEDVGDNVQIRIQDSGCGMPKDVQERIFEPFFTTKPAGKGTGLGLSVSVGIVKDHKGKIYVESEIGKGTTFFIDIPIDSSISLPKSTRAEATAAVEDVSHKLEKINEELTNENSEEKPSELRSHQEASLTREVDDETSANLPPAPVEVSTNFAMPKSRDYLMSDEEKLSNKKKINELRKTIATEEVTAGFQVKIRKPKVK